MADQPVTAVVVNYRSGNDLARCISRLTADITDLKRVVVFDNASGDESWKPAETARESDHRVEVVLSSKNLGLAGAVNLVLPTIDTPLVAVLNPDVTPLYGWLGPLVSALETDPRAAVACPLVLVEKTGVVNSAGQHVHVTGLGFNRMLNRDADEVPIEPHKVGGLHGGAFLMRTQTLRDLGGWDDTGFLYHEDVALSWDVLLAGKSIVCVPESKVLHDYHLTMYPEKLYLLERNRLALVGSHLTWRRLLVIAPALVLTELMVWGFSLVRGRRFLLAKGRSYGWLWRNRDAIAEWRNRVFARGTYDERSLVRNTRWTYPIAQMGTLGTERGPSSRQPPGGLPA